MNDEAAIKLFVEAGNPRGAWWTMDDRDRWPWRKLATQEHLRVVSAELREHASGVTTNLPVPSVVNDTTL